MVNFTICSLGDNPAINGIEMNTLTKLADLDPNADVLQELQVRKHNGAWEHQNFIENFGDESERA